MGGAVAAKMDAILTALPLVKSGKVRALAVTGAKRSPQLPDVPTMREAGYKDFEFSSWYGFWAPAKVPDPVLQKLSAATERIMAMPEVASRLESLGFAVDYRKPAEFSAFMNSEMKRYQKIVTAADIKID